MSIEQFYAANIRKETGFFATWAPNETVNIGDFGAVNGAVFQRFGNLEGREIGRLDIGAAGALADYDIMIGANRSFNADVKARADAGVADGKALLQVNFTSEQGILFSATDATSLQARDLMALGRVLKDRSDRGAWNMDHAVVVQVATAGRATVLLSNESGASLSLEVEANAPLNAQVMANLDAGTSVLSVRGVGMRIVGSGPLTPPLPPRLSAQAHLPRSRDRLSRPGGRRHFGWGPTLDRTADRRIRGRCRYRPCCLLI